MKQGLLFEEVLHELQVDFLGVHKVDPRQLLLDPLAEQLVRRVALLDVLGLSLLLQDVLQQAELGLVLVVLPDGLQVGPDHFLDEHQFLAL